MTINKTTAPTGQNIQEAKKFLAAIAPEGKVTFQTFDDNKERNAPNLRKILHGRIEEHEQTLSQLNSAGAGIFFMVNRGDGHGRRAKNVTNARAIFVDLDQDGEKKLKQIQAVKGVSPRLVTESSPGRFHVYWLIDGELPLNYFTPAQKHFADLFGGDPATCDLPRVMRLPGFIHSKGTPFRSRIILDNQAARALPVSLLKRTKKPGIERPTSASKITAPAQCY